MILVEAAERAQLRVKSASRGPSERLGGRAGAAVQALVSLADSVRHADHVVREAAALLRIWKLLHLGAGGGGLRAHTNTPTGEYM